ncbi:MAG: hypothetical protein ACI9BW_001326 [Gammaproteobacteria bacterium]|jgi:hypothetical protein
METASLGTGEVAFAMGSLVFLCVACLLYGNLDGSRREEPTDRNVTLILFKGLTRFAAIASVLGWLLLIVVEATVSKFSIDPWVIASSSTLVASSLNPLLHNLTVQKSESNF